MKKIFIALLGVLLSISCWSETNLKNIDWHQPQNISFPIMGCADVITNYDITDTVTFLKFTSGYPPIEYKLLPKGLVERRFVGHNVHKEYMSIANNPIELGLYCRDKAKVAYWSGTAFYIIGIVMNIVGATVPKDYHNALIIQCCSTIPYAIGTGSFIAGWVFQVRANRCFLVGSTNYEISASYRF